MRGEKQRRSAYFDGFAFFVGRWILATDRAFVRPPEPPPNGSFGAAFAGGSEALNAANVVAPAPPPPARLLPLLKALRLFSLPPNPLRLSPSPERCTAHIAHHTTGTGTGTRKENAQCHP